MERIRWRGSIGVGERGGSGLERPRKILNVWPQALRCQPGGQRSGAVGKSRLKRVLVKQVERHDRALHGVAQFRAGFGGGSALSQVRQLCHASARLTADRPKAEVSHDRAEILVITPRRNGGETSRRHHSIARSSSLSSTARSECLLISAFAMANDWFGRRAVKPTEGARSMKKMLAFLLLQSHLVSPRKRLDWMFVLSWAGVIVALSILFAVR